jgi:hypothetical protein
MFTGTGGGWEVTDANFIFKCYLFVMSNQKRGYLN